MLLELDIFIYICEEVSCHRDLPFQTSVSLTDRYLLYYKLFLKVFD